MLIKEHRGLVPNDPDPTRVRGDERQYQWVQGEGAQPEFLALSALADAPEGSLAVRIEADEDVSALAPHVDRLTLVALAFPKYRDGRAYSAAAVLRERYGYTGELRAVGEVLREQAWAMARVGFDSFEPADGSTPEDWTRAVNRYRHVYQRAEDARDPVFQERAGG